VAVRAAVGLGSNVGDRAFHIADAIRGLAAAGALVRVSSMYETAPVGGPEQGNYLNAVVVLDTNLSPGDLLEHCLAIEQEHGRERRERWGPRTLDLDILLYGAEVVTEPDLTIPHPRMMERRFVLEPLLEAWPDASLPDGTVLKGALADVADQRVRKVQTLTADRKTSLILFLVVAIAALVIWWLGDWILG
jgi:2-amino-4-hydroxy-6-hydroxymethyldihydropteridine diphosphokinase